MKLYNKERKSEEIADTPNRVGISNRIQGKDKRGKSSDSNFFEALSNQDDDEEEEKEKIPGKKNPYGSFIVKDNDNDKEMKEAQDATQVVVSLQDVMDGATVEEKGIYPLFAPPSAKSRSQKNPNIINEVNAGQELQLEETGLSLSTATVNEGRGRNKSKLITTEGTTKKAAPTRSSGRKAKGSKGGTATEKEGTLATDMMTEATTATEGSKGDSTERLTFLNEGKEGEDTSGTVPHVPIRPKSQGSGHSKTGNSTPTNQSTISSSKKATFAELATKLPSKIIDKEIKGWTAVVSLVFKVQKGEEPKTIFAKKMDQALKFLQEVGEDPEAAVVPVEHVGKLFKSTKTIKKYADVPKYVMKLKQYFVIDNPKAFNPVQQANGRSIKASAKMFFSKYPQALLEEAEADLKNLGCGVYYKPIQEVHSKEDIVLLGAPMVMNVESVEKELTRILKETEKGQEYKGDWALPITVSREHAAGMPWETEEQKKNSIITTASKQVYTIHVSKKHYDRLSALLREIKDRKVLHKVWGPTAFTVKVPSFEDSEEEKVKYQQMVGAHISIQMSMGTVQIPGIIDANTKHELKLLPGADGPRNPTLQSIKDILSLMTVGEGDKKKNLFTCVVEGYNGSVCGFFSSVDQEIKERIPLIRTTIASQLYYFLIKRGCTGESIKRMFRKVFTIDQNKSITLSKYNKETGLAVVAAEEGDDIIRAAELVGIDTSLGLTAAQRKERRESKEVDANQISFGMTFGETKVGAFEAFNVSETQSLTSLHSRRSTTAQSLAANTLAQSKYSIDSNSVNSDSQGSLEEQDEEEGSKVEAKKLVFDGLDIVKQQGKKSKSMTKEEGNWMEVQVTEDQQDVDKKTEGILLRKNLALATELLDEVDSGEEDFFDARNREDEQPNDGEAKGGYLNDSESGEEEYTDEQEGEDDTYDQQESMSQDTNDQYSNDSTTLNDQKEDEEEEMYRGGSMQAELDALMWDNQEEKDLERKRQEGYRMVSNPRSFKSQIFNEAGPKFEKMIAKCAQVLNEMDLMALGKERDTNKFSDKLLNLLQSDVGSEDLLRMAMKADEVKDYLEQRNRNNILHTNERRTAILEGLAADSAGADSDSNDDNPIHNNQAPVGNGGGTSTNTTANSTTTAFRRRSSGRRATTRRQDLAFHGSVNRGIKNREQSMGGGNHNNIGDTDNNREDEYSGQNNEDRAGSSRTALNYMEIKQLIERRMLRNKKGKLTDEEIKSLVKELHDHRLEEDLNHETVDREMRAIELTLERYNVEQLGKMPIEREDGAMRILVCQMGGLASPEVRAIKIAATERLIKKYDINVCVMMEINFNWSKVNSSANLASWFQEEREVRSVTAHNTTEQHAAFSKHQPGGTGILVRHEFLQYARKSAIDETGLGRWCSWPFYSNPSHATRIVVAYRPGSTKTKGLKTVYQQHKRYMQQNNIAGTPVEMFDRDLDEQIKKWRGTGERVILLMDVNDNPLRNGLYDKIGRGSDGMEEFSHKCWGSTPPNTHARGSKPIDGGYISPEIEILNLSMLNFVDSPGDHRSLILDVSTRSLLGEHLSKICRPVSRRLVTAQTKSVGRYNKIFKEQCDIHRIQERMNAIDKMTRYCGYPSPQWLEKMMKVIHAQLTEIRKYAEKKCRKILTPHCEFSPTIKMWYDRIHVYMQLIKLKEGKTHKARNLFRFARKNGIRDPEKLSMDELQDGLQLARIRKVELRTKAGELRNSHLRECLLQAQANKKATKTREIKQRMQRENNKKVWYLIKRTVRDPRSPPVLKVQQIIDGELHEYNEQEEIEQAIQRECEVRFTLAHSAPIMNSLLGEKLRYLSDEEIARQIITGTYDIPEELDPATKMILGEIGKMGVRIVNEAGVEVEITPEDFKQFWKRVNEFTSSSMSGIHYGHYKAAAMNEFSTSLLSQQLTIIARSGVPPESWSVGLQVMLEKIAGICLVDKLRAIQLYEADFNFYNQFVFGKTAMNAMTEIGLVPEELFSQKGSTAEDAKFDKTLTTDISRQSRNRMTIISADAANCYDRVNHVIMSLIWLTLLNGNTPPIVVALICLQTMRFFQRTGFGESKSYFGGINLVKYIMGLGQGSRAAPPSWIQLSAVLVNVYKQLGLGSFVTDPITLEVIHSIGGLFVDDADLYTGDDTQKDAGWVDDPTELWLRTQGNLDQWSRLLQASGGALKPEKCFWYSLDYVCVEGKWNYIDSSDFELRITSTDGEEKVINQKSPTTSMKTLGVHDAPAGGNQGHLDYIRTKTSIWINRMKNGHLPSHIAWIAYKLQLWASLRYGIGTMTNNIEEAEEVHKGQDREMLNILGISKNVTKGLRRLQPTFGGFGLFSLATEQLIGRLNLMLQHYHTPSNLSRKLDVSLKYLQLQIGSNRNPLSLDFDKWGHLAPLSWTKMLWRSLDHFQVEIYMKYDEILFPREKDQLVMDIIMTTTSNKSVVQSLNRCRCHLGALFMSDLATAEGKHLEQYALGTTANAVKSKYKFPREDPSTTDWKRWRNFWINFTTAGRRLKEDLGVWKNPSHRTWRWYYDKDTEDLQRVDNNKIHHYRAREGRTRHTTEYDVEWTGEEAGKLRGLPTSVTTTFSEATVRKLKEGPQLTKGPSQPADFWDFLNTWGGSWMWEGIDEGQSTKHDLTWVVHGMRNKSLYWVTDGSYNRKRAADISGVGWVIFCKKTGKRLTCWCWERSGSADSYRAEMLGLCALHLFARALSEYYKITHWEITISCDNLRALNCSSYHRRRIQPSSKCADIRRSFRSTKQGWKGKILYEHVYGHMDDYLLWHQLSTTQQINCVCDTLAKRAVKIALRTDWRGRPTQLLPREDVALMIKGEKVTNDISQPLRFHASKVTARKHLIKKKKKPWTEAAFDEVDWEHLELSQKNKPDTYKIWRSKQNSGFCGTRVQVGRYSGESQPDEKCPNCGQREIAEHLMLCPDSDRTRLLKEQVGNLHDWLVKDNNTDEELAYWIPKYLLTRGTKPFAEMGDMSVSMRELATSQDKIGWRRFTEGCISKKFHTRQTFHLRMSNSRLNGTDWTKQLISKLLQITHSQWIYRNITLHDRCNGYLHNKTAEELAELIHKLAKLEPVAVPHESRFLLEMDTTKLVKGHVETQAYWVTAVLVARKAQARKSAMGAGAKRRAKRQKMDMGKMSSREKLGIVEVERQIFRDRLNNQACGEETVIYDEHNQSFLDSYIVKRPHVSEITRLMKSNKRLRKPD